MSFEKVFNLEKRCINTLSTLCEKPFKNLLGSHFIIFHIVLDCSAQKTLVLDCHPNISLHDWKIDATTTKKRQTVT